VGAFVGCVLFLVPAGFLAVKMLTANPQPTATTDVQSVQSSDGLASDKPQTTEKQVAAQETAPADNMAIYRRFDAAVREAPSRPEGPQGSFLVRTRESPGFYEKQKFYGLGIEAENFIHQFGKPDGGGPYAFLHYHADGFMLNLDKKRCVARYLFYAHMAQNLGKFNAAVVVTDTGVKPGDSAEDVINKQGKPLKDESWDTHRLLTYPYVTYSFCGGSLENIIVVHD